MHVRNSLKLWKRIIKKPLKVNFSFFSNPVPFNGQDYEKQKGPETSDQSLFRLQNQFRNIPLLVMYYLTKIWGCNIKRSLSYLVNATLCKPIHNIKHSTFTCPFDSGMCGKEGEKNTKIWIFWERKELFRWFFTQRKNKK